MWNKIVGLTKKYKIFTSGEGRNWAAILVNNSQVDTMLIKQLSGEDAFVLEVIVGNTRIFIANMYLDIHRQIDIDMLKIQPIILQAKGAGVLITMDSNSRSTLWHDIPTEGEECWRNF
jgi:hypothetical protein